MPDLCHKRRRRWDDPPHSWTSISSTSKIRVAFGGTLHGQGGGNKQNKRIQNWVKQHARPSRSFRPSACSPAGKAVGTVALGGRHKDLCPLALGHRADALVEALDHRCPGVSRVRCVCVCACDKKQTGIRVVSLRSSFFGNTVPPPRTK